MHLSCASTRTVGVQPTVCAYTADISRPCLNTALLSSSPGHVKTSRTRKPSELRRWAGRTSSVGFSIAALMGPPSGPTSAVYSSPRSAFDTYTLLSSGCSASHLPTVRSILAWLLDLSCLELLSAVHSLTAFETRRSGPRSLGRVAPSLARVTFCVSIFAGHDDSKSCGPVSCDISPG